MGMSQVLRSVREVARRDRRRTPAFRVPEALDHAAFDRWPCYAASVRTARSVPADPAMENLGDVRKVVDPAINDPVPRFVDCKPAQPFLSEWKTPMLTVLWSGCFWRPHQGPHIERHAFGRR